MISWEHGTAGFETELLQIEMLEQPGPGYPPPSATPYERESGVVREHRPVDEKALHDSTPKRLVRIQLTHVYAEKQPWSPSPKPTPTLPPGYTPCYSGSNRCN